MSKTVNDHIFDKWLAAVDNYVETALGLSIRDLVDQPYYDWFEAGYAPDEAADEAVENAFGEF